MAQMMSRLNGARGLVLFALSFHQGSTAQQVRVRMLEPDCLGCSPAPHSTYWSRDPGPAAPVEWRCSQGCRGRQGVSTRDVLFCTRYAGQVSTDANYCCFCCCLASNVLNFFMRLDSCRNTTSDANQASCPHLSWGRSGRRNSPRLSRAWRIQEDPWELLLA